MRNCAVVVWLALVSSGVAFCDERRFVTGTRLTLGTEAALSASVRIADLDGNGELDVVVANGRHWPGQNYVFLNQGRTRFSVQRELGSEQCTSYAAEPADLDGDGDIDIAVGNDMAPGRVYLNDGAGRFEFGPTFGEISSVRSLAVADIDRDGDLDVLSTCRGRPNQIYLNDGNGHFAAGKPFGNERDSTIDVAVADWNRDGHLDLVLANRDDQQNSILINDGHMNFTTVIPFGTQKEQTRAVAVADLNGDAQPDVIAANIGQPNRVYLADGKGGFAATIDFGREDGRTYALAIADMDNDKDLDLIVGNVGQENAVFFNRGDGKSYSEVRFGDARSASYGVDTGDLDGDGFADIVVANSDARNNIFLNRTARSAGGSHKSTTNKLSTGPTSRVMPLNQEGRDRTPDWNSFRGNRARGIADGFPVRTAWNADKAAGDVTGVLWTTRVPGLGHSSPVISGDRIFLATAIAAEGKAPLKVGRGGQPDAADDKGEQSWVVLCYDRRTGEELWRKTSHQGRPRATRHAKATHANTSIAVDGDNVVAFFGSEGIHCYDLDGNLKWSQDLGVINISKYGIGWGFASSPVIHNDRIAIVCDDPDNPFVATLRLSDGEEIWRTSRKEICERSWGTPLVHTRETKTQVVVNGWPWIVSYDLNTGEQLWRIRGGGDNPVPTPFEANGWIYITSAHGAESPIFVVRPDASGDVSPPEETGSSDSIVWSTRRGGSYMSTPVVYGDYLYLGNTNGVVRCFHARTGEKIYEKRLGSGAAIISSLVAADGKVYCASENGIVYVLKAGPEFEILARNQMGEPCFATPAISRGVLYLRTTENLIAIR
jgi:outer membrane protein assembly factor BamB